MQNALASAKRNKVTPAFADVTGDGLIDMVICRYEGNDGICDLWANEGTANLPDFPGIVNSGVRTPSLALAAVSLAPSLQPRSSVP